MHQHMERLSSPVNFVANEDTRHSYIWKCHNLGTDGILNLHPMLIIPNEDETVLLRFHVFNGKLNVGNA